MRVFRRGLRFCSLIERGIGEYEEVFSGVALKMHMMGCMMASVAGNGT